VVETNLEVVPFEKFNPLNVRDPWVYGPDVLNEQVDDLFRTLRLFIFKILVANIFRPLLYRLIDYQFVVFIRQFLVVVSNNMPPYAE